MFRKIIPLILLLTIFSNCSQIIRKGPVREIRLANRAYKKVQKCVDKNVSEDYQGPIPVNSKIDTIIVSSDSLKLNIFFNKHFSYQPFRSESIQPTYDLFKKYLGRKFRKYEITISTLDEPIQSLVPNYYRSKNDSLDRERMPQIATRLSTPLIQNISKNAIRPTKGLYNKNIALWHSHGFYYTREKNRWEWQRPRLFLTVEDLLPMSFTIPYIVPMLENSGANVFLPRERSLQTHEIVIDNDSTLSFIGTGQYRELNSQSWKQGGIGFGIGNPPYPANLNPFLLGSYRYCQSDTVNSASTEWIPEIPADGNYGVYISYHHSTDNIDDAHYSVFHVGGKTDFLINQQIGGETWLFLGDFKFKKGLNPDIGKVVLTNESKSAKKVVTADAARFGGGMGNILRGGRVSGYPRFAEGARYYLQYAGMPDTLVYNINGDTLDYRDDYQSRGEWVNYLKGAPFGPNKNRNAEGLDIPIDLSMSFHTDAGIDTADSTIGTLMIYSIEDADTTKIFPDGMSRLANRDLADIVQTQIVNDIRLKYRPDWNRRALMNADYSEAFRPNVPGFLLELLSHQNFKDMQYALSPQFRFDVSRSIYKGMLKFLATQFQYDYVVQPLPVSHFYTYFSDSAEVTLKWKPVNDPIETTAVPDKYLIYTKIEDTEFDHGTLVDATEFVKGNLEPGVIYRFKITAINSGGESFPSEELSVCWNVDNKRPVLIINGFDRIAPPEIISQPEFKGFAPSLDPGVADRFDFNFTGNQFDFDPRSQFRTNDAPGHGASQANFETKVRLGNTFNYPYIHGSAIKNCGYSFVSCSDEAVMDEFIDMKDYLVVDLILGEEKATKKPEIQENFGTRRHLNSNYKVFPKKLQQEIRDYFDNGGNLFVSGAYVGSDLVYQKNNDSEDVNFARNQLKISWQTDHAVVNGSVFSVDSLFLQPFKKFDFNTSYHTDIYMVDAPDAINPADSARTILRYSENRFSAATAFYGNHSVIVFGFPFETIIQEDWRNSVMKAILTNFENN